MPPIDALDNPADPSDDRIREATRLPSTLSGLLETALDDASSLNRETYTPYSDFWHRSRLDDVCEVCLAGCLIARTLDNRPAFTLLPIMFSTNTRRKLETVNLMRLGNWYSAFTKHYLDAPVDEISQLIRSLPQPVDRNFCGWERFLCHINSLRGAVKQLREIDALARKFDYLCHDACY